MARALHPGAPDGTAYQAMRVADRIRENLLRHDVSFCMETVLPDTKNAKLDFFRLARSPGFRVVLIHIRLACFPWTAGNAARALGLVDYALVLYNSPALRPFQVVATWAGGVCMPARQPSPP